jgi:hypothetical protein
MKGDGNPNFGKRWVNKQGIVKLVDVSKLDDYLDNGWVVGKRYKNVNSNQYGKCWINKDGSNKFIHKTELNAFLEMGWTMGRIMSMMQK